MDGIEGIPAPLRRTALDSSSRGEVSTGEHGLSPLRASPRPVRSDVETPVATAPMEGVRKIGHFPASFLVVDSSPPEGFASPFRVSREIEDRWFRPASPRSIGDPLPW
ncbi:MAG TPA: hypothetical protein VN842_05500 [Thermoplasmata archaeon]|nr:hypothetical protein [Thermoplasmata archaeon]